MGIKQGFIVYEGNYVNGIKIGRGKEFNYKGELLFEGEYFNDERLKGKAFYRNGNVEFEGEYLYGNKCN